MDMPSTQIELRRPRVGSAAFRELVEASRAEGYFMLTRLLDGWRDGSNRFNRRGEMLLAACRDGELLGVGGLNVDPYVEARREGRIRHLYVAPAHRRHGVGRALMRQIILRARDHFPALNLRATPGAFAFYEAIGFLPVENEEFMTHRMAFQRLPRAGRGKR